MAEYLDPPRTNSESRQGFWQRLIKGPNLPSFVKAEWLKVSFDKFADSGAENETVVVWKAFPDAPHNIARLLLSRRSYGVLSVRDSELKAAKEKYPDHIEAVARTSLGSQKKVEVGLLPEGVSFSRHTSLPYDYRVALPVDCLTVATMGLYKPGEPFVEPVSGLDGVTSLGTFAADIMARQLSYVPIVT